MVDPGPPENLRPSLAPLSLRRVEPLQPPEAGTLLAKIAPEVLARWEDRVRQEVPAARTQDRLMLFDEIPLFLARMALTLTGELDLRGDEACREHGEQRARECHYPINGVIQEYRILRKTIIDLLEEEAPLALATREMLTDIIELSMQEAADRYVAVQQEELREANRLKDAFVATVAHELRTPLSAVSNALYLLQNVELDERSLRQLSVANRQTNNLRRLVEDIMDLSRITHDKLVLQCETVDIGALARQAAETVQASVDARGQDLTLDLPPSGVWLQGDPVRLEQIVVNLLNNASNFTPAGGSIRVELEPQGPDAVLRVRDSGVGIPTVMLPQIFDLFAQVDAAPARTNNGLGIGLSLVKRLVTMHGGAVTARSFGEGQGTEFTIRLPLESPPSS